MQLNEAIKHLTETLTDPKKEWPCEECRAEHKQLLDWLNELREFREAQGCGGWYEEDDSLVCSACGERQGIYDIKFPYCPHCGAKMEGDDFYGTPRSSSR